MYTEQVYNVQRSREAQIFSSTQLPQMTWQHITIVDIRKSKMSLIITKRTNLVT
jgi:hypothetical protein